MLVHGCTLHRRIPGDGNRIFRSSLIYQQFGEPVAAVGALSSERNPSKPQPWPARTGQQTDLLSRTHTSRVLRGTTDKAGHAGPGFAASKQRRI